MSTSVLEWLWKHKTKYGMKLFPVSHLVTYGGFFYIIKPHYMDEGMGCIWQIE